MSTSRIGIAAVWLWIAATGLCCGGDWPQILGPDRNGHAAADERIADRWPAGGPPVLWERPVGHGDAGVAIVGDRGVLFHRMGDEEITEAFHVGNGQTIWKNSHSTTFAPQVGGADGPLCVPTIVGNRVISFGAQGVLTCCDFATGRELWKRNTHRDFNAPEGYFGAGSTPLVIGNLVIVNVGGSRDQAGVVAFSLETGETVWTKTNEPASYSAPIAASLEGVPVVILLTRYQCLMLEPTRGQILFQFAFGQRGPTVNAASPVLVGKRLLVTAAYGIGCVYGDIDITGFTKLHADEKPLATQYCTPIYLDGFYYAIDGRDDLPPADLKCIDFNKLAPRAAQPGAFNNPTFTPPIRPGSPVNWVEQNFGYGTLLAADHKLIAAKTDGELLLIRPNTERLEVLSRSRPLRGTLRALPALSNGRLYVRDDRTLKCLDLTGR